MQNIFLLIKLNQTQSQKKLTYQLSIEHLNSEQNWFICFFGASLNATFLYPFSNRQILCQVKSSKISGHCTGNRKKKQISHVTSVPVKCAYVAKPIKVTNMFITWLAFYSYCTCWCKCDNCYHMFFLFISKIGTGTLYVIWVTEVLNRGGKWKRM